MKALLINTFLLFAGCFIPAVFLFSQTPCVDPKFSSGFTSIIKSTSGFVEPLPKGEFVFNMTEFNDQSIVKVDALGDVIWSKTYKTPTFATAFLKGGVDKNGNIVSSLSGKYLILTDPDGNIITSKSLNLNTSPIVINAIAIASNNDKIVLLRDYSTYGNDGYMLVRLSADMSAIIWNKKFAAYNLNLWGLDLSGNEILISGGKDKNGILMIFDFATGTLFQQKEIFLDNGSSYYYIRDFKKYNTGYIAQVENSNSSSTTSKAILRFDLSLNQINSYYLYPIRYDRGLKLYVEPSGSIVASGAGSTDFFMFLRISAKDSILSYKTGSLAWFSSPTDFKKTADGFVLLTSSTYTAVGVGDFGFTLISNFDANGNISGCPSNDAQIEKKPCNTSILTPSIIATDVSTLTVDPAIVEAIPNTFYSTSKHCYQADECNMLKIEGQQIMCGNNSAIFKGKKNSLCSNPVNWTITGGNADFESLTDSTTQITFSQSGNYKLIAAIYNVCDTLKDTLDINVTLTGLSLNLGADISLCHLNTKLIKAQPGFLSYKWQDGSSNSSYLVTQPGKYYVTVQDACNNIFSDTIVVTQAPPVPLNLGPDKTKCNNDTLHLNAPSGFINYSWGPDYNISSATMQNIIINPSVDTSYYIKAEKTPGCFGFDTIEIKVNISPAINLGNDTSFCSGQSIILSAGSGFNSYLWSNNDAGSQLTVNSKGLYSVIGTTLEGCKSYDTLQVLNVFINPVVQLNKDTGLCAGTSKILDAGNFPGYLWNNGSMGKSVTVNAVGLYSVTVTDLNGCQGTDSSSITVIYPSPSFFLPADTAICSYGKLDLKTTSLFETYLWSNNQSTSVITISKPGIYWLQVKDRNNCYGTDSILVAQKQCMTGFFMPTAFTPDGNQLNDDIKPFVFGNVLKYEFTIFNRWGQIVFQTNDLLRGWDGNLKSYPQDSGTYSWTCLYQLDGEQSQLRKGTVMLIR